MGNYIDKIRVRKDTYNILPSREVGYLNVTDDLSPTKIPTDKRIMYANIAPITPGGSADLVAGLKKGEDMFAILNPAYDGPFNINTSKIIGLIDDEFSVKTNNPFIIHFTCVSDTSGSEKYFAEYFALDNTSDSGAPPVPPTDPDPPTPPVPPTDTDTLTPLTVKQASVGDYLLQDGSCAKYSEVSSSATIRDQVQDQIVGICVHDDGSNKYFIAMPSTTNEFDYKCGTTDTAGQAPAPSFSGPIPEDFPSVPEQLSPLSAETSGDGEMFTKQWETSASDIGADMIAIALCNSLEKPDSYEWYVPSLYEIKKVFDNAFYDKFVAIKNALCVYDFALFNLNKDQIANTLSFASNAQSKSLAGMIYSSSRAQDTSGQYAPNHYNYMFRSSGTSISSNAISKSEVSLSTENSSEYNDGAGNIYAVLMPFMKIKY